MAYIKKLASGNYQTQIRLKGLRPITRTFSTKAKARLFARKIEGDSELARKLGNPVTKVITFFQLVDLYMNQYRGRDPSKPGRLAYWCNLFGNKMVTEIDEFMVDDGLQNLAINRSGSTVNRYKSDLSSVFTFFIRHPDFKRLGYNNPVLKESVSRYSENPAKEKFLDDNEQKNLLWACKRSSWQKLYLLVLMALTTGARKSELLNLKWSDIDFKKRAARLKQTKNGKPRLLPLTQPVILELMKYRDNSDHLIFHNTKSKTTPYDFKKLWLKALNDSEIDNCRFHDLRHTAASNLVRAGRTLFEVGTLLGHSSTTMTARYSHLAIQDTLSMVDEVMGRLS